MYLIIGGLVLAAIIAFFVFGGNNTDNVNVTPQGGGTATEGAAGDSGAAVGGADTGTAVDGAAGDTGNTAGGTAAPVGDTTEPTGTQPLGD